MLKHSKLSGWVVTLVAFSTNCGGRTIADDVRERSSGGASSSEGTGGAIDHASGGAPQSSATGGQSESPRGGSGGGTAPAGGGAIGSGGLTAGGQGSSGAPKETGGAGGSATGGEGSGGTFGGSFCVGQTFDTDPSEALACEPWTVCEPGTHQLQAADHTRDRICEECPDGTFTDRVNQWTCTPWSLCSLGEVDAEALSNEKDRSCRPDDVFPRLEGRPGGLVVTESGVYAPLSPFYSSQLELIHFSPEGTHTSTLLVDGMEDGGFSGTSASDIAHLGNAVYIAGSKWKLDSAGENPAYPGFLIKVGADGQVVWEEIINEGSADDTALLVATAETNVSIIGLTGPNRFDELPTNELFLHSYDGDGRLVASTTIEESSNLSSLLFYEQAANQHHYLVAIRAVEATPALCAELESNDDHDFSYHCTLGIPLGRNSLLVLDETGALVAEYVLGYHASEPVMGFELDAAGTAYVFAEGYSLHRLEAGGTELHTTRWDFDGDVLGVFTVTDDALLFAGSFQERSALFTMAKTGPPVLSRDVLSDFNPANFTSIEVATDGTVFVAGSDFVVPWPD